MARGNIHPNKVASLWERSVENLDFWGAKWVHFPSGRGLRSAIDSLGFDFQETLFERIFKSDLVHSQERGEGPPLYERILSSIED